MAASMVARLLAATVLVCALAGVALASTALTDFSDIPALHNISTQVVTAFHDFWDYVGPGGKLHPAYFLEHKGHLVIEGVLIAVITILFLQHSFKPRTPEEAPFTEKEIDALCAEWQPEPLVPALLEEDEFPDPPVVERTEGNHVVCHGTRVLNMASANYHGLSGSAATLAACEATVGYYGVGSCGPRGFYGTFDVHIALEGDLARFMGTENSVIYAHDNNTVSSVIAAFANRKDTLVVDEYCNCAVQQGCRLSKAAVYKFRHNDTKHLEAVLARVDADERREGKPRTRRYVVVEGVYASTGEVAPLAELAALKERYKWRLIVDETWAFGVLGEHGRGAAEHCGLKPQQADIVCAALSTALGGMGGFCAGSEEVCEHQQLSSQGYCFSASMPPYLAAGARASLQQLRDAGPHALERVRECARVLRSEIAQIPGLEVVGGPQASASPLLHVRLRTPGSCRAADEKLLHRVVDHALQAHGVLFATAKYTCLDVSPPPPSIKVFASAMLSEADRMLAVTALCEAARAVLQRD